MLRNSRESKPPGTLGKTGGLSAGSSGGGTQDAELFLLSARSPERLVAKAAAMADAAAAWTGGQFALRARDTACKAKQARNFRAAVVASNPVSLSAALTAIAADPLGTTGVARRAAFFGQADQPQRIVFAFPHGGPAKLSHSNHWLDRFWECRAAADEAAGLLRGGRSKSAVQALHNFAAGYAGLQVMQRCNVRPDAVIGAGNGELLACAAAGIVDEEDLLPLAAAVAREEPLGGMLSRFAFDDPAIPTFSASSGLPVGDGGDAKAILAGLGGVSARFAEAATRAAPGLLIEIGPNGGLAERAAEMGYDGIATEAQSGPVHFLLLALAAAFAAGAPVNAAALYEDRRLADTEDAAGYRPAAPARYAPAPSAAVLHA